MNSQPESPLSPSESTTTRESSTETPAQKYRRTHREEINRRQRERRHANPPSDEEVQRTREYHRERSFRWKGRDIAQSDAVSMMLYGRFFDVSIINKWELQKPWYKFRYRGKSTLDNLDH